MITDFNPHWAIQDRNFGRKIAVTFNLCISNPNVFIPNPKR